LAERDPTIAAALRAAVGTKAWIGVAVALLAFVLGVASDAIGPSQRINLLAPPLLAVLAWNLLAYAFMALHAAAPGPLRRGLAQALRRPSGNHPALVRYAANWAEVGGRLHEARAATVLHACAFAFALGALASLYLRGLVFEYRAGWDSTFLSAAYVHALLSVVLGPASWLSGMQLPDAAGLELLRFSRGPGENAARWIHLHAITIALLVLVPRMLLAASAAWRARNLAERLPLAFDTPYFKRLLRARSGEPLPVEVLPYSYELPRELVPALRTELERHLGAPVSLHVAQSSRSGDEENVQASSDATVVALFPLTATPERETHGVFVDALVSRRGSEHPLLVVVDESAFRQRFGGNRITERRGAWQRMLADLGHTPVFVDLG
jgi:hypothetical protein